MLVAAGHVIWLFQQHLPPSPLLQIPVAVILFLKYTTTDSQSSVDNSTNVTDHQEGANATAMQNPDTGGLDGAHRWVKFPHTSCYHHTYRSISFNLLPFQKGNFESQTT